MFLHMTALLLGSVTFTSISATIDAAGSSITDSKSNHHPDDTTVMLTTRNFINVQNAEVEDKLQATKAVRDQVAKVVSQDIRDLEEMLQEPTIPAVAGMPKPDASYYFYSSLIPSFPLLSALANASNTSNASNATNGTNASNYTNATNGTNATWNFTWRGAWKWKGFKGAGRKGWGRGRWIKRDRVDGSDDDAEGNDDGDYFTTLTSAAKAGSTVLEVASVEGFRIGVKVVIDEGKANEEVNTVKAFSSMIMESALQYDHDAGTTITTVATLPAPTDTTVDVETPNDHGVKWGYIVAIIGGSCAIVLCCGLCIYAALSRRRQRGQDAPGQRPQRTHLTHLVTSHLSDGSNNVEVWRKENLSDRSHNLRLLR